MFKTKNGVVELGFVKVSSGFARSGIVHHLSGLDRHAHTRTLLRRSRSTSWSVFQDESKGEPIGRCQERADDKARQKARAASHDRDDEGSSAMGLSPSLAPPSRGLMPGPPLRTLVHTTIRTSTTPDSQARLFPVRSPLLGESFVVLLRGGVRRVVKESVKSTSRSRRVTERCVTPRKTCPRPEGSGRNLRSKTRWLAGSYNSHQVSHFTTFFIDVRAEISVAESRC
ncbi:protein TAR1-like [Cucumis melo var. makuwa]|uniref:Protein TAR1-like n=1 Tax=Cucumis melo var. makuwa TaxID=1194695 RepID=A0A5D3BVR5_CUCMM|nr:protein TAR1-like [Cucumis melo var. makuwa]